MPLKTLVKVGGVTNLSDARYCAGMGVDMLGFCVIEGHENYLAPKPFQEIRGWVAGPAVVAEIYGLDSPEQLVSILENYRPDYLEMGVTELSLFTSLPLPYILSIDRGIVPANIPVVPAYLSCRGIPDHTEAYPLLIQVDTVQELNAALNHPQRNGIALKGGSELSPGLRDYDALADILELLDVD